MLVVISVLLVLHTIFAVEDSICDGPRKFSDAIVILGQKRHSSYDATHTTSLHPILLSIMTHYPHGKEADILIFQEGDILRDDLIEMDGFNLRLCLLQNNTKYWGEPDHWRMAKSDYSQWSRIWSRGYHYMIRFYAVTIWGLLDGLGYKWMMRFDDDSRILSHIDYNMFHAMRANNKIYGFRMYSMECGRGNFGPLIDRFTKNHNLSIEDRGLGPGINNNRYCKGGGKLGYYNNFAITNVTWWVTTPLVQTLIRVFDQSNLIITDRDGDLLLHTAIVRLFTQPQERMHFLDWSYYHHTVLKGDIIWGGIESGTADRHWNQTKHDYIRDHSNGSIQPTVLACPHWNLSTTCPYALSKGTPWLTIGANAVSSDCIIHVEVLRTIGGAPYCPHEYNKMHQAVNGRSVHQLLP
jgi:hypothetical protein